MLDTCITQPATQPAGPLVGADGISPVIAYTADERNLAVVAWYHHSTLTVLPVVSLRCHCGGLIRVEHLHLKDLVAVSRVNGDSEYGYEAYHRACC